MKYKRIMFALAGIMATASAVNAQSYFDDDIYYDASKATKKSQPKKVTQTYTTPSTVIVAEYPSADTYTVRGTRSISVDDYNRRGIFASDSLTNDTTATDFTYTRRIEQFYNPEIVSGSGDAELANIYYMEPEQVNVYINTPSAYWGYDYFYPSYGWYNPYWSWNYNWRWNSPWYWNSWYDPYWAWGPSWGWGPAWGPSWGWGPGWGAGWGPSWGGAHRPSGSHAGRPGNAINNRPNGAIGASGRPGLSSGVNNRPSVNGRYPSGAVTRPTTGVNGRPGTTNGNSSTTRPANNSNNNNNDSYSRPANTNTNGGRTQGYGSGSYNQGGSRSSGSSWGGSSGSFGGSRGGSVGGGRSSGGGRGRH